MNYKTMTEDNGTTYRVYDDDKESYERMQKMLDEINLKTRRIWGMEWWHVMGVFYIKIYDENYNEIICRFHRDFCKAQYQITDFLLGAKRVAETMSQFAPTKAA